MEIRTMRITARTQGVITVHTSLQTWIFHEAEVCAMAGMEAGIFAGYMTQFIPIATLKTVLSRNSYNNLFMRVLDNMDKER